MIVCNVAARPARPEDIISGVSIDGNPTLQLFERPKQPLPIHEQIPNHGKLGHRTKFVWHLANHQISVLWRFHRMHHGDPEMDATTGLRFHIGEALMSATARLVVLPLIGMELWQLVVYESVFLPVVLLHHSNTSLPRWLDYGLLAVIVTPAMHRVHHSRWRPETDSN